LKLLRDLAESARVVAGKIKQPPRSNAVTYPIVAQSHDEKLHEIEQQLSRVSKAIDGYLKQ